MSDAIYNQAAPGMIYVHLGAHRTGTTLFQEYLYNITSFARSKNFSLVGIDQTRSGLMDGLLGHSGLRNDLSSKAKRSLDNLERFIISERSENRNLLISDENILGSMEYNLQFGSIYPYIVDRLKNFEQIFRHVNTFYISIREIDIWWSSCLSYLISSGHALPSLEKLTQIGLCPRTWRDVILEIMTAFPTAKLVVREFNFLADNPKRQLIKVTRCKGFEATKRLGKKANRSKDVSELKKILHRRGDFDGAARLVKGGRFQPFSFESVRSMRGKYQQDILWLRENLRGEHTFLEARAESGGSPTAHL